MTGASSRAAEPRLDQRWIRWGYILIASAFVFRLAYLASGTISLSGDEAYQWMWSKHPALSYYSKPPGIAFIQLAGTSIWGDTQFGVRFFSPVFAAVLSLIMLRFLARVANARAAFLFVVAVTCTPLMDVGAILMTIDPPLVVGWTLAMVAGWTATGPDGTTRHWLLAGLGMGLAFLCKYNALYELVCFGFWFAVWPPARVHLRRPGPYLAILVVAACALPVIIWNARHDWITLHHVATNAGLGLGSNWRPQIYTRDFLLAELGLLNPVFFVAALWALWAFWKLRTQNPFWLYLFCMGGTVFIGHLIYTIHSRVLPNWIAPAVLPMLCLMVVYWESRWQAGSLAARRIFIGGTALGAAAAIVLHFPDLIGAVVRNPLPGEMDPAARVRGWTETAAVVEQERVKLEAEGKPAFIVCDHYSLTGLLTFASPRIAPQQPPLIYCLTSPEPRNQFYFWPEYQYPNLRKGQNAVYVAESDAYRLEENWYWKWLRREKVDYAGTPAAAIPPPALRQQFESVTNIGLREVFYEGRLLRRMQIFACRNLR